MADSGRRSSQRQRNSGSNRQTQAKQRAQPRPNKKKTTQKRRASGAPAWVWFISGLALATAAAAIVYIVVQPDVISNTGKAETSHGEATAKQSHSPQQSSNSAASEQQKDEDSGPRFEFYRLLPNYDSTIDQQASSSGSETDQSASKQSQTSSDRQQSPDKSSPADKKQTSPSSTNRWRIQAGAFSQRSSARKRQARLTLLGVDVELVKKTLDSGKSIYRVRSQPIESQKRVDKLRSKLEAKQIDLMVEKIGS